MKVIIAGCGRAGEAILASLVKENNDILVIDKDPNIVKEINDIYDVMCVEGSATHVETLKEAEVSSADFFVAMTPLDEVNMLSCFIAKKMGAKHVTARIRDVDYNDENLKALRGMLDIHSLNPDRLTSVELYHLLKLPSAVHVETYAQNRYEMCEIMVRDGNKLCGSTLIDMRRKYDGKYLVGAVQRGEKVYIPDGSFEIQCGDKIGVSADRLELRKLMRDLGILKKEAKNIMIIGASRTTYYLASELVKDCNVKVIDRVKEKCDAFASAIPKAMVIHADASNHATLIQEGIESMDAFVSLTGIDEENLLFSYFAKEIGVPTVIAKVNKDSNYATAEKLGIDLTVSPRILVSESISRSVRAMRNSEGTRIESLYKLMDEHAEAIEFVANDNPAYIGIPLKDLHTIPNVIISGIIRDQRAILPSGDSTILVGDRVIIISAGKEINDLADIVDKKAK